MFSVVKQGREIWRCILWESLFVWK